MSFISYAQNFEDVMLWRALKHIENGFYIDVGANDPTKDSVTKAFYDRGWHGVNVEPLLTHFADLQRERPRDINLQCAAGSLNGELELWECDVRGWATFDKAVAALHSSNGHEGVFHKVQVLTLAEICNVNVNGEIHFLKIDVEGFEKSVIEGMDFNRFRPWILVIEATRPNSTEEVYQEWETNIFSAKYEFAYSDGLNRFYVAKEHFDLLCLLRNPPNVFDGFVKWEEFSFEARAQQAEAKVQQAEAKVQQAEAKVQQAEFSLIALQNSYSWQITYPLRLANKMSRILLKASVKYILQPFARWLIQQHKLASLIKRVLRKNDFAMRLAKKIIHGTSPADAFRFPDVSSKESIPHFSTEHKAGALTTDQLLLRIKSEINLSSRNTKE